MSSNDLCSSESSDSVASVIHVNGPKAAVVTSCTTAAATTVIMPRLTASGVGTRPANNGTTVHGDRPPGDRDGGGVKRPRHTSPSSHKPTSLIAGNIVHGNGCYDDSSESSSDEDDDEERRIMEVDDDGGCGGRCQLDMDTSSSSSESSQIWNPIGSVRLSLSGGRQLKSPTPKTAVTYRSSTGAINQPSAATATKSRCWSLLVADEDDDDDDDLDTSKTEQRDRESDDTSVVISNLNVSGFLETDLDEDYHPRRQLAVDGDHWRRSLVAPVDSGLGNETSPELADDDDANLQPTGNIQASASVDQSPCSSVVMRPLPQPSLSFCSPSCSFLRSSMSSIHHQHQQPDDDVTGDCGAIYSTPSTCRASLRRMQPVPPPSDDTRDATSSSNNDRSNAIDSSSYKNTTGRIDTSTMLSCLYAMFIVVVGASLSLAEVLMDTMSVATFEGFYSYLFLVGIAFLVSIQLSHARRQPKATGICTKRQQCRSDCGSESLAGVEMGLLNKTALGAPLPVNNSVDVVKSEGGTFFLRLGAVGFAIGAMVSEGLQLAQFVEMRSQATVPCINANEVIRTFLHIVFIFTQLYFVFMHAETHFRHYSSACRLGLMHLIATDVCVWLRVIVLETLTDGAARRLLHSPIDDVTSGPSLQSTNGTSAAMAYYHHSTAPGEIGAAGTRWIRVERIGFHGDQVNASAQLQDVVTCLLPDVTSRILSSLSPYLYPCIIQYCWATIALNGLIWYNVSQRRERLNTTTCAERRTSRQFDRPVDSGSGTSSGVFGGIIILVTTVVLLVVSLVLSSSGSRGLHGFRSSSASNSADAIVTAEAMSDVVRLTVSSIALAATVIAAVCLFRRYDLVGGRSSAIGGRRQVRTGTALNEILLVVSLAGVLAAGIFGAVAGRRVGRPVAVAGCIASATHAAVQTIAVAAAYGSRHGGLGGRLTPTGRQTVAFLTVCNVAVWLIDVAQEGGLRRLMRHDRDGLPEPSFAGDGDLLLSRRVLGLVCVPLAVFHRFQSVVCLSVIWKRG